MTLTHLTNDEAERLCYVTNHIAAASVFDCLARTQAEAEAAVNDAYEAREALEAAQAAQATPAAPQSELFEGALGALVSLFSQPGRVKREALAQSARVLCEVLAAPDQFEPDGVRVELYAAFGHELAP